MTDQDPIPTARMPVPNERDAQHAGDAEAPDQTAPVGDTDQGKAAAPITDVPPVAPASPMPTRAGHGERDSGRTASVLFGLVVLGLGLWFFAEHTLGYELPRIRWSQLWPVFLIGIGLWIVLGTMRRGSR